MSFSLVRGRYTARLAETDEDLAAVQGLRGLCFRHGAPDRDAHDLRARHVMVHDQGSGALVCCFRMALYRGGDALAQSYAAQFYGLGPLAGYGAPLVEMGRFCIHPECRDADILRVAWGALTCFVDEAGAGMLFGCSSFAGTDWRDYRDSFALLAQGHLAPACWTPEIAGGAPVVRYAQELAGVEPDRKAGLLRMPPLLRSYISMGGWVSRHAVIDHDLETLHVFTGLEIAAIPEARRRVLRAV